jgi:hypothetical protein
LVNITASMSQVKTGVPGVGVNLDRANGMQICGPATRPAQAAVERRPDLEPRHAVYRQLDRVARQGQARARAILDDDDGRVDLPADGRRVERARHDPEVVVSPDVDRRRGVVAQEEIEGRVGDRAQRVLAEERLAAREHGELGVGRGVVAAERPALQDVRLDEIGRPDRAREEVQVVEQDVPGRVEGNVDDDLRPEVRVAARLQGGDQTRRQVEVDGEELIERLARQLHLADELVVHPLARDRHQQLDEAVPVWVRLRAREADVHADHGGDTGQRGQRCAGHLDVVPRRDRERYGPLCMRGARRHRNGRRPLRRVLEAEDVRLVHDQRAGRDIHVFDFPARTGQETDRRHCDPCHP